MAQPVSEVGKRYVLRTDIFTAVILYESNVTSRVQDSDIIAEAAADAANLARVDEGLAVNDDVGDESDGDSLEEGDIEPTVAHLVNDRVQDAAAAGNEAEDAIIGFGDYCAVYEAVIQNDLYPDHPLQGFMHINKILAAPKRTAIIPRFNYVV